MVGRASFPLSLPHAAKLHLNSASGKVALGPLHSKSRSALSSDANETAGETVTGRKNVLQSVIRLRASEGLKPLPAQNFDLRPTDRMSTLDSTVPVPSEAGLPLALVRLNVSSSTKTWL